jgi:hypothetical protein
VRRGLTPRIRKDVLQKMFSGCLLKPAGSPGKRAKQPTIGKIVDDAMTAIEHDNRTLKGMLPKSYEREGLDKPLLGELIDLVGTIGPGDRESRSKDVLCRVLRVFPLNVLRC